MDKNWEKNKRKKRLESKKRRKHSSSGKKVNHRGRYKTAAEIQEESWLEQEEW